MKAAYFEEHGGPEVLKYGDVPNPVARSGEAVVDIYAASVNGADWKVRSGKYSTVTEFPYILGRDFSGIVSTVGEGVDDLGVGDAVFGTRKRSRSKTPSSRGSRTASPTLILRP